MVSMESYHLQFEARFYLSEAGRLRKQATAMLEEADKMLEHAVLTWDKVKEVGA